MLNFVVLPPVLFTLPNLFYEYRISFYTYLDSVFYSDYDHMAYSILNHIEIIIIIIKYIHLKCKIMNFYEHVPL